MKHPGRVCCTLLFALGAFPSARAAKLPDVLVTGEPVALSPAEAGTGLCMATSVSTDPAVDFPTAEGSFPSGMNAFMEASAAGRVTSVLRSALDLSNGNTTGPQLSVGDYVAAVPGCGSAGCSFTFNDTTTSFAVRLRGYLSVTPSMIARPLHFGAYADDAISVAIYDLAGNVYQVISRPPLLGTTAWRTTNTVTFVASGLYPVEILYAEIAEHAALELSLLDGAFTDFERAATATPVEELDAGGFSLMAPEWLFQTVTGQPSVAADLDACAQCDRADVGGDGGCGAGRYCNTAAICAPCDNSDACGQLCVACPENTPVCLDAGAGFNCVACASDAHCPGGTFCEPSIHACVACLEDTHCPGGRCELSTHACVGCNDDAQCAGTTVCHVDTGSCVECTGDAQCSGGMVCELGSHVCVACLDDTDCGSGRCELSSHRCVGCDGGDPCPGVNICDVGSCAEPGDRGGCNAAAPGAAALGVLLILIAGRARRHVVGHRPPPV